MGAGTGTPIATASASGNYITDLDIDNWAAGATTAQKQTIIDLVEQLIEKITSDYFYEADFDITLDGNGKDRLYPGLMPDILSITSIAIWDSALATTSYTNDKNFVYLDSGVTLSVELAIIRGAGSGLFPRGLGNVHIVGVYGWAVCPEAITQAAIILARYENDPTLYTSSALKSESIGPYSYTRLGNQPSSTGIQEADILLKNYIRRKPMIAMV